MPEQAALFRKKYAEILPRFEAARVAGPDRLEIARCLIESLKAHIRWRDDRGDRSLDEALTESAEPVALQSQQFTGPAGWTPNLLYRGERWGPERLQELGALLVATRMASTGVGSALSWLANEGMNAGALDLSGRRIVVLGAGAEMAPTRFWLESGADVLWLDVAPPPPEWQEVAGLSGRLFWPEEPLDLLTHPREVLATISAFGDGAPLDLGLYAYAPGQARELLLTTTMNAIVDALPRDRVRSVTLLVSPTTPTALDTGSMAAMEERRASPAGLGVRTRWIGIVRARRWAAPGQPPVMRRAAWSLFRAAAIRRRSTSAR